MLMVVQAARSRTTASVGIAEAVAQMAARLPHCVGVCDLTQKMPQACAQC